MLPLESVSGYLGLAASDIEKLTGLPQNYLTSKAPVIHLAKLKSAVNRPTTQTQEGGVVLPFNKDR
ncbi:hypothetical protein D3C76_1175880 [compost metagenome]